MAYIVASDVHLGTDSCNQSEFCEFLKWVRKLEKNTQTVESEDGMITIEAPEKIILLGDILELWDPKNGNRDYVIKDSIIPFQTLSEINCDKIYVVGNHDDSLSELEAEVNSVGLPHKTKFEIYNKHYPQNLSGVEIGCKRYFFLHGHQFDKEQAILSWASRMIGERWNPLGWFQDLFNIAFAKNHWKANLIIFLILLSGGQFLWDTIQSSKIPIVIILTLFAVVAGRILVLILDRFLWNKLLQESLANKIIWAAVGGLVVYLSASYFWMNSQASSFLNTIIWATLTGFFAMGSIPGVVAKSQRSIYDMSKPRDKTAKEILTEGYYRKEKDTIRADRVVFGHTHFAGYYGPNSDTGNKLFINSGCWYGKDDLEMKCYTNTFVYIDKPGAYLLRWRGCGKIECIKSFPNQ